jgi:hypothetical protein
VVELGRIIFALCTTGLVGALAYLVIRFLAGS